MAQNQVYLIKSGENSFVEETQAIVGISGGKVGIGTTHPEADLHVTGSVKVGGDLTVDGTLTTINSTTVSVDDKNIELGSTDNPTDVSAEGGGITVKGDTDKTFNWYANGGWTSSENLSVADGKHFAGDELRALDAGGLSLFDTNQSGITIKGGKVGIHKTAPGYDLDVDGSGNFGSLYVDGNAVLTGEGSIFGKWEDGATQGEIFYTGGNVGVGTTNPEHNFHVFGNGVVDGNFVVNGTSGTFNVGEFDVSGSNITLNSAGGGLDSSRGGLIVNAGTNKTFQYVGGSDFWQSSESMQIVADKHLQTDKVRAIDAEGLYLEDDGGNGIYIQDGGNVNIAKQVNVVGLTKADGGLNVGNGKFNIQSDGTLGSINPNADDVIKWDGTKWVAAVSPGGGGGGTSEVPSALINSLISGESIQQITYGPYDSTPKIATDLEIVGDGSVIPYALSGVSETGYFAVFSQEIPNNNYKIHTVFGGKDVYWETGSSSSIYYNDGDVSLQRNLTIGGNLTVAGSTTSINTQTLEIEDHNIVIASNTGYNQLTDVYPVGGDYAGVFWGTGDAGAASPVSLTYQSNKGFTFDGGNVGIGTANPDEMLTLTDKSSWVAQTNGPAIQFEGKTNNGTLYHFAKIKAISPAGGTNNAGQLGFYTTKAGVDVERVRIDEDGNVGIGTTSPTANLHIGSNTSGSQWIRLDTQYGMFSIGNGSAGSPAQKYFSIYDQDVNQHRLFISNAGNVGIGTTSPSAKLHVDSGEAELTFGNNASGGNANLRIWRNDSSIAIDNPLGYLSFAGSDAATSPTDHAAISAIAEESHEYTSDPLSEKNGTQLTFFTTNLGQSAMSRKMTISANGNVGIGTTSPDVDLHIGTNTGNAKSIRLESTGTKEHKLQFASDGVTYGQVGGGKSDSGEGDLRFYSYSGGLSEAMRIDSKGNVGIGTTDPITKLDINEVAGTKDVIQSFSKGGVGQARVGLCGATSQVLLGALADDLCIRSDGHNIRFGTASATRSDMTINTEGNVGIGITIPKNKLSVICGTTAYAEEGGISLHTVNAAGNHGSNGPRADIVAKLSNNWRTNLLFKVNKLESDSAPTEVMRINSSGRVGIGTTSPGAKLEVYNNSTSNLYPMVHNDSAGNAGWRLKNNQGDWVMIANAALRFYDVGQSLERMRIDSDGNVGIGTTNPGGKLHIATKDTLISGTVSTVSSNLLTASGSSFLTELSVGDSLLIEGKDTYTVTAINSATQVQLSSNVTADGGEKLYRTNNKNLFFISEKTRNVGIGTTNPDSKLHVSGDYIQVDNGYGLTTVGGLKYIADLDNNAPSSGALHRFFTDNGTTTALTILKSGNVGIGTANPGAKLEIKNGGSGVWLSTNNLSSRADFTRAGQNYINLTDQLPTDENSFEIGPGYINLNRDDDKPINQLSFAMNGTLGAAIEVGGGTPSSPNNQHSLRFKVGRDNLDNKAGIERMRITHTGNVGIGTTSPGAKLDLQLSAGHPFYIRSGSGANDNLFLFEAPAAGPQLRMYEVGTSNVRVKISTHDDSYFNGGNVGIGTTNPGTYKLNVNGTTFCTAGAWGGSDDRIKHNEQPIVGALETLSKITPKKYIKTIEMYDANHDFELDADGNPVDENGEPVEHHIEAGVIAQQVLTVDELAFAVSPEGVDEDGTVISPHGLDYNSLFTYAIAAIQEQQQLIEQLKSQNESLAARISALES